MAKISLLNSDAIYQILTERINEEMIKAAEPIISDALKEIEYKMREKLGAIVIAHIENYMEIEKYGQTLKIVIKQ